MLLRLKPDELTRCFMNWDEALHESINRDIIASDGKNAPALL
jgi:hypothetical protein